MVGADSIRVSRDGRAIFTRRWLPEGPPRGAVMIAHGMAEHGGRYARLAAALNAAGLAVYAHDHRGHGPDCPPDDLGWFAAQNGWRACIDDMTAVADAITTDQPGVPMILFAHSMGSFMAQRWIGEQGDRLAGAVLSGTAGPAAAILSVGRALIGAERLRKGKRGRSKLVMSLMFDSLNKPFEPARTPLDWLSRDAAEVDAYIADPLCGFTITAQMAMDVTGALEKLASPAQIAAMPLDLPLYILSGERDPVGAKLDVLIERYRAAGLTRMTVSLYPDARHEMINETNRDAVVAALIAWIDDVLAGC